jgi:hypothetical protein
LLLWGFCSKKFLFWNETTGELIFEHNSGGANRIWDFYIPSTSDLNDAVRAAWFAYTSKGEVSPSLSKFTKLNFRRVGSRILQKNVNRGNHGREIRCVVASKHQNGKLLLASGSEDTYINFTKGSAGQKEIAISPLRVEDQDILSVEFGGFSNAFKSESDGHGRDEDDGGDLRITGLDVRDKQLDGVDGYLIALIFSDSTIKVVPFGERSNCSYIGLTPSPRGVNIFFRVSMKLAVFYAANLSPDMRSLL